MKQRKKTNHLFMKREGPTSLVHTSPAAAGAPPVAFGSVHDLLTSELMHDLEDESPAQSDLGPIGHGGSKGGDIG
jgi:hypothetical protein